MAAADERKPVTVLFADLAGSTELATRHDPEQLRAPLAAFFEEMRQQVEAFGGTVEKYAGDAVMAVFGVPRVHEDDAERAVRAALAMRESLEQLNPMFEQEYGVRLALRVGVASGEAVAAAEAVTEFLVTGEVANLAARLQSAGDGVVVSEATRRLLGALIEAEPLPPLHLKGFPQPVSAYRVSGIRPGVDRPRGIPGLSSPVVGRDREMETLHAAVEELRRGRGQIVTIIGEPGIGKSRLKIEIRDNHPPDIRWLEGRCQSYTQGTGYTPIVQMLRSALGIGATDPTPIARTKLRAGMRALAGARSEQALPALAHLLGVEAGVALDPRALQSQIVVAVRAILEGLGDRGPVVFAVEDLHWADTASVELLTVVAEMTDTLPLMLLVTCRPEAEGEAWTFRFHAERNYAHRLTELRLTALAPEASQRLADNLLRVSSLPDELRRRVLERSEGNPFFLEEILRGLIEQGVLRRDGERWVAVATRESPAIPDTLRGVLAARIDRLPADAKATLQRAAVVGRFFTQRELAALADNAAEVDRALAHLLRAELIREWARLPERQYVFKHALTRDAAYASLLGETRRMLHARVARHLESRAADKLDEQAPLLAHHWTEAGDWERALHHTLRAAERARALYARPEAIAQHWAALDLLSKLPASPERRRTYAEAVLELVNLPGWARSADERERGLGHLREARRVAEALGNPDLTARADVRLGYMTGDERLLRGAIEAARAAGLSRTEAFASDAYSNFLGTQCRFEEGLPLTRRSIEIYEAEGMAYRLALVMNFNGRCWSGRAGRLGESLAYAARFRAMAEELNDAQLRAWRAMEAEPYVYKGLWADAVRVAEESLPIALEIGESVVILFASAWLGIAYLRLGRREEARRVLARALAWGEAGPSGSLFSLSYISVARALGHLADGELDQALARAQVGLDYARRSGFALEHGAAHRVVGQVYEVLGRRAEADAAYRQSLEIFEAAKPLPELGQTLLAYGRFRSADAPDEGRRMIERARDIFARIDAPGWLAEADHALCPP